MKGDDFVTTPQLSSTQMEGLIQALAQQLHCDPIQLRQQLQSGNINAVSNSMDKNSAQHLQSLLRSPRQIQQVMNSPEMKELLRKIQGR